MSAVAASTSSPVPASGGAPVSVPVTAGPGLVGSPAPCRTLYVRNLCEKQKKEKLRVLLHALFSPYGEIEWISASKTLKLRGQAFITFRDIAGATTALRRLQGTSFLSRPLRIAYARSETDRGIPAGPAREASRKARKSRPRAPASAPPTADPNLSHSAPDAELPAKEDSALPNRILRAQNAPQGPQLAEHCARFAGFVEVRQEQGEPGIVYVEYKTPANAAVAVSALDGVVLVEGTSPLQIGFAKI